MEQMTDFYNTYIANDPVLMDKMSEMVRLYNIMTAEEKLRMWESFPDQALDASPVLSEILSTMLEMSDNIAKPLS